MILHDRQLIFFHIPKVAGTSVERAIYPKEWDTQEFHPRLFVGWRDGYGYTQHAIYRQMLDFYNEAYLRDYFKFCFVRNPWDRMVSAFCYSIRAHKFGGSFGQFVADYHELVMAFAYRFGHHATPQMDYLLYNGEAVMDFIGRYETLAEDWRVIAERFGFPPELTHQNGSERGDYRDYYTDRTRAMVQEMYGEEIAFFDYQF